MKLDVLARSDFAVRDTAVRCDRGSYEASGMATGIDARTKYPPSPGSDVIQGEIVVAFAPSDRCMERQGEFSECFGVYSTTASIEC